MDKIRIGIVGAGYIGGVHAGLLARDERARVVSVYDVASGRADALARSCGAGVAREPAEVLDSCDAVYVTTPNTSHTELAVAACAAGLHVFCEKPLATNMEDARAVLKASASSGRIFQVGHNRRFAPVYAELKRLLEEGGPAHSAHVKMNRGELLNPEWVGDSALTGGYLYETPVHMFDMVRFLFGEVTELYAVGSAHDYPETDDFSVLLRFKSGAHATLATSADASWLFPFERVEVFRHHQTLVTREMESLTYSDTLAGDHRTVSAHQLPKEEKWGYAQEDKAFIDSVLSGAPPPVTALDGFKAVQLVDACYRAVRNGGGLETMNAER
ncbi:MAG TPA: Gfo/Idh/MocA family oxidoreductase [Pyrinomonadaceae bacterium]|nr:Gfo/Idh/MocA family oxidoreductase [Pyrinomonadaceae bacterium]